MHNTPQLCYHQTYNYIYHHNYIVGSDYTTLTGQEDIRAVFFKGSNSTFVEILIRHDLMAEGDEDFTAELQTDSQNTSTKVIIRDAFTVQCNFDKAEYDVYESVGSVTLTLNSSRATFKSRYTLQVDTIYGMGTAFGELV